ncbi:MAG: aminopeptidase [Candidatus Geothermarchaeales archaeon]
MVELLDMMKTCKMAVEVCAALKPHEDVCIVTDTNKARIADVLAKACRDVGAETVVSMMTPRQIHGNEPPKVIAAAMKAADVIFAPTTYALTHTDAMVEASEAGARAIIMRGITEEMMVRGAMTADYEELKKRTGRVADRLTEASSVRVLSEYGTDVRMSLEGRVAYVLAGFATDPGSFAALPDGEAPICPVGGTAEGTIVFDHTMDGIGLLKQPIRLEVEGGWVTDIGGGEEAKRLREIIEASDQGATNIAEFAIGTNPEALLIGNMAEDKKKEGSVHIAIGDNHKLGGTVTSSIHLDGLMVSPTVELDGEVVVKRGRLLL